ncbi:5-formyltetrahydrofolate cyclo-ligase [Brevibacterium salitolerans]|uniref:5-formyltetrahydrofolate cyclo-ligase n=1 Tax=Brevibacterium salitolerans TaxID=1403566 RepID=A0ABN2WJ58_9MICO
MSESPEQRRREEHEEKTALRAEIRAARRAQAGQDQGSSAHTQLCTHAAGLVSQVRPAAVIGYAALPGEPSIDAFLESLAPQTPAFLPATRRGEPLRLGRLTGKVAELPARIWGIREPEDTDTVAEALARVPGPADLLVLVPGLAYDGSGVRLGNGGGFYDRTFGPLGELAGLARAGDPAAAAVRERLRFVGVCWERERVDSLPCEDWDLTVSAVLTENGVRPVQEAGA